jgi:hypothetical protein
MKKIVTMCDPPSGWRYGFPKVVPEGIENLNEWLVSEGYPQKEIDSYGQYFYTRSWYEEIEE